MQRFKIPPQVVRLVILTVAIVASYAVARQIFMPRSFGQYGHYRGDALIEIASREPRYAGQKSCNECHSEVLVEIAKYEHKSVSCETCHGISKAHGEDPDHHDPIKPNDAVCLRCHTRDVAKPAFLKQIDVAEHYSDKGRCVECHLPHQPNEVP